MRNNKKLFSLAEIVLLWYDTIAHSKLIVRTGFRVYNNVFPVPHPWECDLFGDHDPSETELHLGEN